MCLLPSALKFSKCLAYVISCQSISSCFYDYIDFKIDTNITRKNVVDIIKSPVRGFWLYVKIAKICFLQFSEFFAVIVVFVTNVLLVSELICLYSFFVFF